LVQKPNLSDAVDANSFLVIVSRTLATASESRIAVSRR
jgi:hypothetical protein